MNWRTKARIQNAIAMLPESFSNSVYYAIQRKFGGLKSINPVKRLNAGIETWRRIQSQDRDPKGGVFFEVGTGRTVNVPLSFWLMGAEKTITIDLNPYLKEELVLESIDFICNNKPDIEALFGELIEPKRFEHLIVWNQGKHRSLAAALDLIQVRYIAPGDAMHTSLPPKCIDFHTSFTVFEHIPGDVIAGIILEANRLLRPGGMLVHCIDYSDHFAHDDKSIGKMNFLQIEDKEWNKLAGNRYMYMNRIRHHEYLEIFKNSGQTIVIDEPATDPKSLEGFQNGALIPATKFNQMSPEQLAITSSWIVSQRS